MTNPKMLTTEKSCENGTTGKNELPHLVIIPSKKGYPVFMLGENHYSVNNILVK